MIYQHRNVICRSGRLEKRHAAFKSASLAALDSAGSLLLGAWEICIGQEAGAAVWQLRQFDSFENWVDHQDRVRGNEGLGNQRTTKLFPHIDEVDTSILKLASVSPELSTVWPKIEEVQGAPSGYVEQRILRFQPGALPDHHNFYQEKIIPALDKDGAKLIGLFDCIIGPGTSNANSFRSVELRRFDSLASWQNWYETQSTDAALADLVNNQWKPKVAQMHSCLMRPLDYSRIR